MKDKDIVDEIVDGELEKYLQKLKNIDPIWNQKIKVGKKLMKSINGNSSADESSSKNEPKLSS